MTWLHGFVFLSGFVCGILVWEKTRRPNVYQNEVGKIKGTNAVELGLEVEQAEQPKKRKKFLGIFKRKEK